MSSFANISATAFLIAEPSRAAMLMELMDGRALPAGELARASGITAQTASAHLAKLLEGGLVSVETQGRHRYYRLAHRHIAQTLEYLGAIHPAARPRSSMPGPRQRELRFCRCCYDHLAGQVGVAMTRALQNRDYLRAGDNKQFVVTPAGAQWFAAIGLDVSSIKPTSRGLARQCLDWTERSYHVAGPLGSRLMGVMLEQGWLGRSGMPRALTVTPKGWLHLGNALGMSEDSVAELSQPVLPYGNRSFDLLA